jgi:hypothetical protein
MAVYTLFGQPASPAGLTIDTGNYTMGVQFSVSLSAGQTATCSGVWWFSPSGAGVLPDHIALFAVSGRSLVTSQAASWSGAAGSGWVRAPFTSPPSLTGGASYKACIFKNDGNANSFYGSVNNYWTSGAGGSGISNGPLSAPNNAGGDGGQDTFDNSGVLAYPLTSFNATNYWADTEVTVLSPAVVSSLLPGDQATASGGDAYGWLWEHWPLKRNGALI